MRSRWDSRVGECAQLDYEVSALEAIQEVFASADRRGCFFHFTQCIWRKVQNSGLQAEYKDPEVKFVRSLGALALVSLHRLDEGWMEIDSISPSPEHPSHSKLSTTVETIFYRHVDRKLITLST